MVFSSFNKFFSDNTRVRILFFPPEFNTRLYDKNSESDYVFFLHQNQNIFFSNIGSHNIFLGKNHNSPLQVKWSFPYWTCFQQTVDIHILVVPTVLLFSSTSPFIRTRLTSYRDFSRKTKRSQPHPLISRSIIHPVQPTCIISVKCRKIRSKCYTMYMLQAIS